MTVIRKLARAVSLAALTLLPLTQAVAVGYPDRSVTLVVPFEVGGPTDILARILADTLGKTLGQTVIVENKGGAGGAIGSQLIANAKPDGYTIGLATISTHVVNPSCNKNLPYDPIKSFTPVALLGNMPNILVVREAFPANTFQEFRKALEQSSEKYSLGTAGPCSFGHVMAEHLNAELGTKILHVPFRGSGPASTALLAGSLDMMMDIYLLFASYFSTGKVKALAVAWPTRIAALPNTPTFDEIGLPNMSTTSWYGVVAPAGLAADRLALLSSKIAESLKDPTLLQRFAQAYIYPAASQSPEEFKAFLADQFKKESTFINARQMGQN